MTYIDYVNSDFEGLDYMHISKLDLHNFGRKKNVAGKNAEKKMSRKKVEAVLTEKKMSIL
jgi:hypothetical protein